MNPSVVPTAQSNAAGQATPGAEQDLYGLLGLAPFESNANVISAKVRELMRETRKYQLGPYAAQTQSRMEQFASATACLLDPARKAAYDEALRRQYGMPPVSVTSTYASRTVDPLPVEPLSMGAAGSDRQRQSWPLLLAALAAVVSIAAGVRLLSSAAAPPTTPVAKPTGSGSPPSRPTQATTGKKAAAFLPSSNRDNAFDGRGPLFAPDKTVVADAVPAETDANAVAIREAGAERHPPLGPAKRGVDRNENGRPVTGAEGGSPPVAAPPNVGPAMPPPSAPAEMEPAPQRAVANALPKTARSSKKPAIGKLPAGKSSAAKPSVAYGLGLTPSDVLRELRDIRLKRTPAMRLTNAPRSYGADRAVELVRYARATFGDERRFQRQLDQEVVALKRVYPQLRDVLPDPSR